MSRRVRIGVIGVGHFGRFHARQYAAHPLAELVGVADVDDAAASHVAGELGCSAFANHQAILGRIDAASVAVPTPYHFKIAKDLLEAGVDVLVEKPMTHDVASAVELAEIAERTGRTFQVGHIERYSASFSSLRGLVDRPLFIESNRIAPFRERGTDIDVVFDLMIHDIDIILGLVRSPVTAVHAVGTPVFSGKVDMASARFEFENGCVATATASRVSHKTHRSLRIFQEGGYIVCDFGERRVFTYEAQGSGSPDGPGAIASRQIEVPPEDSLANEIDAFLSCILNERSPTVDGRAGLDAMRIAEKINQNISRHRRKVARQRGPG
jgi:predicted dehydrogenase